MSAPDGAKPTPRLPDLKLHRALDGMLEGKVGIVTGASHGIGAATAAAFARAGADVVVAARNEDALKSVAESISSSSGREVLAVVADVTDPSSARRLVERTRERFGRLDVAFNNAGEGHRPAPLAEVAVEDFDRAIAVNARGTFLCMKYEIPAMLAKGGGAIVNMSSTAGLEGVKGIAGYVAGKHAIIGLTRTAAMDYGRQNLRVNAVAPGPIFTERLADPGVRELASRAVPAGRVGDREEVAAAVVWLCSDLASFVTGAVLAVDGGRTSGVWFQEQATAKGLPRPDQARTS
ncbi:MAG TPA: glucose 1-dehydrogenase [Nitrososphaerales archaeon]|nr:glucose 1-dehydrogenase [Nitrososphaerales archaeon]